MKVIRVKVPLVKPVVRCSFKRILRTMPSVVLLVFVVGLIFLTLMQIAVIHANRRALYLQREPTQNLLSSGQVNTISPQLPGNSGRTMPTSASSSIGVKSPPPKFNSEIVRVEAFVDKNAPTVEAIMVALQTDINVARVRVIVARYADVLTRRTAYVRQHKKPWSEPISVLQSNLTALWSGRPYKKGPRRPNQNIVKGQTYRSNGQSYTDELTQVKKELCPPVPPSLVGRVRVGMSSKVTLESVRRANPQIQLGGTWKPSSCRARHRVGLIIPYRDREEHLARLLAHLLPILQKQQTHFKVYVVEQFGNETFNKGVLMNAGVREALKELDFHCFVFHDVDMMPEDDRNMYTCPRKPRHLSVGVDKFNYTLPYTMLVGGVFAIKTEQFALVNGYSNLYWGWGGEDDDIAYRIKYRKLPIIRPPDCLARYSMIKHNHRPESPNNVRTALLRMSKRRSARDGLNSVKYRLVSNKATPLFSHLLIDIGNNHRWKFVQGRKLVISF